METKPLLFGLIGFFVGGLLVSVAATTFDKPKSGRTAEMSMSQMIGSLRDKQGDDYDEAFIASMIEHHEGAIEMARQSADKARHDEIKKISDRIITAQEKEISEMRQWQDDWGYGSSADNNRMSH